MRQYRKFNYPGAAENSKTLLTGIRKVSDSCCDVYITGFYEPPSDLNEKTISFVYRGSPYEDKGQWFQLDYPSEPGKTVVATNLYGPNSGKKCHNLQVVGNYTTQETGTKTIGCLYQGYINNQNEGKWTTIIPKVKSGDQVLNTICHSTNGGLVVGNYDTVLIQGKAFIYDIKNKKYYDIVKKGAKSITAYGIWYNGGNSYTICGGYSNLNPSSGVDSGYLVDWDNKQKKFSNWRSFNYGNNPINSIVTHFDGITTDNCGGYYLTGDRIGLNQESGAFFAHVKSKSKKAKWYQVAYPGSTGTSGNSVYDKVVIGVYTMPNDSTVNGYTSYIQY